MSPPSSRTFLILRMFFCMGMIAPAVASAETGPSFDCSKASTTVEHSICGSEDLSALDRDLATAYRSAKCDLASGSADQEMLLVEQRLWNKERANACPENDLGQKTDCLIELYTHRIAELTEQTGDQKDCSVLREAANWRGVPTPWIVEKSAQSREFERLPTYYDAEIHYGPDQSKTYKIITDCPKLNAHSHLVAYGMISINDKLAALAICEFYRVYENSNKAPKYDFVTGIDIRNAELSIFPPLYIMSCSGISNKEGHETCLEIEKNTTISLLDQAIQGTNSGLNNSTLANDDCRLDNGTFFGFAHNEDGYLWCSRITKTWNTGLGVRLSFVGYGDVDGDDIMDVIAYFVGLGAGSGTGRQIVILTKRSLQQIKFERIDLPE